MSESFLILMSTLLGSNVNLSLWGLLYLGWKSLNPDGCPLFSEPTSSPVKDTRWPPYPAGSVLEVLSGSRWLTSYRGAKKKDQASMFQLLQAEPTQSNEKTRG